MKKILAVFLAAFILLSLVACGNNETPSGNEGDKSNVSQNDNRDSDGSKDTTASGEREDETTSGDAEIPTTGLPLNWPDNEYTKLVPAPNCGGKVLTSGEIGTLFAIELKWTMEQGLTYAKLLQDAGFGDDCVAKYEKGGTLDRTANGVNVQLMDLFGTTSLSIMPAEE